ncbi:MAG TPA: alpha/beta hydrolase [Planktothrix sp.]
MLSLISPTAALADNFESNGVNIHYVVDGEGPPVILIHGLYASAYTNWQLPGIMRNLAKHYRVVAFDLRGHGASGKPEEEAQYGVEMAKDVARLLDYLHIEKARIVGYSLGGMVALKFVSLYPQRTTTAVLGGMGWLREGSPIQKVWQNMGDQQRDAGNTRVAGVPPACLSAVAQLALSQEEVERINVPVTMIVGDSDPCRFLYAQPLHRLRKDWPIVLVQGAGHMNCVIQPAFQRDLEDALRAKTILPEASMHGGSADKNTDTPATN